MLTTPLGIIGLSESKSKINADACKLEVAALIKMMLRSLVLALAASSCAG